MEMPRPEYPRPQFERAGWKNLNGTWAFEIDNGRSGQARGLYREDAVLQDRILVPFCPESSLSGIGHKDFMYGVWYQREVELTKEETAGRTVLHFGAADYRTFVYVNGAPAGTHKGGYVSFSFDVTSLVKEGKNLLTVYCEDDTRDPMIPRGKQSEEFYSHNCDYTRTTGIWQTVWLEFMPETHIGSVRYYPEISDASVKIEAMLCGAAKLSVEAFYEGRPAGSVSLESAGGLTELTLSLSEKHLWEPGAGRLYDLVLTYGEDTVRSYVGLRSTRIEGNKYLLNERPVFQRTILDQGFYPDGIYTAPTEEALVRDIELSMSCGFNGARLHQKVFEERFLYHCDRLGYLVWGEYPNWGLDHTRPEAVFAILPEWLSEVERDFNHPAVIGWCPFNETWDVNGRKQDDDVIRMVYLATKAADRTRPCIDTSGNYHVETDIFDVHDYEQDPEIFASHYEKLVSDGVVENHCNARQTYAPGSAFFVSEYGGIRWSVRDKGSEAWGYGSAPKTGEEYMARYQALTETLLGNPGIMGFCYTQMTDVEQEQNGVYTFDREEKFPAEFFRKVNSQKAAIEE